MAMTILYWIIIGVAAGWIAEQVTGRRHGLITNLIVGIVGAVIGGWLASTLGWGGMIPAPQWVGDLVIAALGAILLLLLFGLIRRRS